MVIGNHCWNYILFRNNRCCPLCKNAFNYCSCSKSFKVWKIHTISFFDCGWILNMLIICSDNICIVFVYLMRIKWPTNILSSLFDLWYSASISDSLLVPFKWSCLVVKYGFCDITECHGTIWEKFVAVQCALLSAVMSNGRKTSKSSARKWFYNSLVNVSATKLS